MRDSSYFFDRATIADELGVLELRVGHRLQYRKPLPKRAQWLAACWDMTFIPTFHKHGTIAVVSTSTLSDDDTATPSETIAVLVCNGHAFSTTISGDPVLPLLERIPAAHPPDFHQSRDGYGCCMHVTTTAMDIELVFDNPELNELKRLEAECLKTAQAVARASGDPMLIDFVSNWEQYVKDVA